MKRTIFTLKLGFAAHVQQNKNKYTPSFVHRMYNQDLSLVNTLDLYLSKINVTLLLQNVALISCLTFVPKIYIFLV